jgi:hypothetical protein
LLNQIHQITCFFNNLSRKIKTECQLLSITPVFPNTFAGKGKNNNPTEIEHDKYKILLVHPGYSIPRHYNHIEAVLQLLKKQKLNQEIELYILSCGGAVNACGFVSFYPGDISSSAKIAKSQCSRCQKFHSRRMPQDLYTHINVSEIITELNLDQQVDNLIGSLGSKLCYKRLRDFQVADVKIGDLVIESIQRSLYETTHDEYFIEKGSVVYEYLRSGIIYSLVSDEIFSRTRFDLALSNEVSYVDWGVPARFAIKHGVTCLYQGHHYPGEQFLLLTKHTTLEGMKRPPYIPTKDLVQKLMSQDLLFEEFKQRGKNYLDSFSGFSGLRENSITKAQLANDLGQNFDIGRKNIIVFTHLCWDGAQSFGDMLYDSFEGWIEDVFDIAVSRTDLNWIFRIHPAEAKFPISRRNTTTFLQSKWSVRKPANVFIQKGDSKVKTVDLMPYTSAGLSALGTVCLEFSTYGIPCLLSTRLGYAEFPFVHSAATLADYRDMVYHVDSLSPPTREEQDMALVLFGMSFSKDSYIGVENLFQKRDSSDRRVSTRRLNKWLSQTNLHFGVKPRLD